MNLPPPAHQSPRQFHNDNNGVMDLPMKLVIALVIGSFVLMSIIGFITQFSILPSYVHVHVDPMVVRLNNSSTEHLISISVKDSNSHHPISKALVLIKGDHDLAYQYTNNSGTCDIPLSLQIIQGVDEWFLDVKVKATGYETYRSEQMIRIISN